jgi:hypothetical protein
MLTNDDVWALDQRAQAVGRHIGWELQFAVTPNPQYVGLLAGPDQIVILGPSRISDFAVHEIDLALDRLQRGERRIIADEDGDPRLVYVGSAS